ncbi:MAG: cysteine desulfurase family protein [Patescibacteria group bacterium]|jgi:cysteine desulfurase
MERFVYLDHAATTPLDQRVFKAMKPWLTDKFGNPSSFHSPGKEAKDAIEAARTKISKILSCRSEEIIFTSGGTESDNLAILGFARANAGAGKHIIVSAIEHHAVLEAATQLEKEGFEITRIAPNSDGVVEVEKVKAALRPETILVSVMYANNEVGTIQPIAEIGNCLQKHRGEKKYPIFHTDACQAAGALELSVEKLHVDAMTINGSKIYGPKGIGLLYFKKDLRLQPIQFGGAQERGLRPGTENVAGIVGLAAALELADKEKNKESERLIKFRDKFIAGILLKVPKTKLNGHPLNRLPNNANISFSDIEGEALMLYLDAKGIFISTGSACTSASLDPSHVLLAMGKSPEEAHGAMRFTLGHSTTQKDLDYVLKVLPPLVEKLRLISSVKL